MHLYHLLLTTSVLNISKCNVMQRLVDNDLTRHLSPASSTEAKRLWLSIALGIVSGCKSISLLLHSLSLTQLGASNDPHWPH